MINIQLKVVTARKAKTEARRKPLNQKKLRAEQHKAAAKKAALGRWAN